MHYLRKTLLALVCVQSGLFASCDPNNEVPPVVKPDVLSLKEASPYPFGAALSMSKIRNSEPYRKVVETEFNSITAENAMKMVNLAPSRKDQYAWDDADYLVDFAEKNHIRIHGHCLVWHNSLPSWVSNFTGTKEDWKTLLRNYITTVVSRYKGRIASWDVVNEALLDDGTPRQTIWLTKIGWEYVELAFRCAHEADPDAVLFYNEYGQEYSKVKLAAINDTIMNLVNRGVPIHGIGLQMHTNITQSAENMVNAINRTVATGLKVHISELDIALNPDKKTDYTASEANIATQKSRYRSIAAAMYSIPAVQSWGITTWGVGDDDSWLKGNPDYPLLFDKDYKQKSCYDGVQEAFSALRK
ncbi:MAG: endo-1,4-beta-xylanase [Dysgonamonadaceae bacterium]|jgi:endo-1,4-beta-xylanase|nr:endo-1,4-beta-xylanase [Dysgonamonadaceae bacterium]